ncbi:fungal-specific transcription factor domain-containing protein [Gongronella butleri]|nr:fungal-specific transcription factor domain-containing protein [Gongronella butleri]
MDTPGSPTHSVGSETHGQLSVDACGHVRYLGRSSGFYLLQGSRTFHDGVFHFAGYDHTTSSATKNTNKDQVVDPYTLPPTDLSEHLLTLYFERFYYVLPLFYKKQLVCPEDKTLSPLLLNAIYAVASRLSDDIRVRSDPDNPDTAGDLFYERAKRLLDDDYDVPRISTVQALILLSSHQQGAAKTARAWLYSGMAFRMALDLGLNRNAEHWHLSLEEKERRKRVFWVCFMVDRLTSAVYGRALTFDERDCDVPFPAVDDDEPLPQNPGDTRPPARLLQLFIKNIKICDILGHVLKNIYYAKSRHHVSRQQIEHVLSTLHQQMIGWHERLPPSLQYEIPDTENGQVLPDPPSYISQLHMIYHTTMILLHRSFIPGPMQDVETSFPSYDLCINSARANLHIISIMRGEKHLRHVTSYTVYFAFTAGIIFIKMAASSEFNTAFDAKVNVNTIMRALEDMEKTWLHAGRCCNILGELAGLKDINLVSDEYVPRRQSRVASPPPAIAVPNSPEPTYDEQVKMETIHDKPTMLHHPSSSSSSSSSPPQSLAITSSSASEQSIPVATNVDPFAAPGTIVSHAQSAYTAPTMADASPSQQQHHPATSKPKIDLYGTAFWGVPTSTDPEEWNQYFAQGANTPTSTMVNNNSTTMPTSSSSFDSQSLSNVAYALFNPAIDQSPLIQSPSIISPSSMIPTSPATTSSGKDHLRRAHTMPVSPSSSYLFSLMGTNDRPASS